MYRMILKNNCTDLWDFIMLVNCYNSRFVITAKCLGTNVVAVVTRVDCSKIPLSPAYGVYISQLIRYARACFAYEDFSKRGKSFTKKLMSQGYNESRLKSSFREFYGRYNDLVCDYKLSLAHILNDLFHTLC
jgi:hypothetical protein